MMDDCIFSSHCLVKLANLVSAERKKTFVDPTNLWPRDATPRLVYIRYFGWTKIIGGIVMDNRVFRGATAYEVLVK